MSDAGWYPDPIDPGQLRYWDGSAWSDEARPRPSSPALPSTLPSLLSIGVDPSTASTPPPATAAAPPAARETTSPPPPNPWAVAPNSPGGTTSRSRRGIWPIVLFTLLALAVIGGAAFGVWKVADSFGSDTEFDRPGAIVSSGDGDGSVPEADLMAALGRFGVACGPGQGAPLSHSDLVATAERSATDVGTLSPGLGDATSDFVDATKSFDADATYSITTCGSTLIVVTGDTAVYGYFDGMTPPAVAAASAFGLRLVSLAPPRMDDTVDLIERRDESCPLPGRTTTKEVLLAELLPRLAPADGSAPAPSVLVEKQAIENLPDEKVVVRNCTHTRVLGVESWAQLVIITGDSTVEPKALGQVKVIGP